MNKKLGTYIVAVFFSVVSLAIIIGSVSIVIVNGIVHDINHIGKARKNIDTVNSINIKVNNIAHSIHHFIIEFDDKYILRSIRFLSEVENDVKRYKESVEKKNHPESLKEIGNLEKIQDNLTKTKEKIIPVLEKFVTTDLYHSKTKPAYLDHVANDANNVRNDVEHLTNEINRYHFNVIDILVNKSYGKMTFIVSIYVIFSALAILISFLGYRLLTRHTILPLKDLASATQKIAKGDLSIRVSTKFKTEVGTLYKFFNTMAGRLQENEARLSSFNSALEKEVRMRTSELEEAYESLKKTQSELNRMERIATLGQIATTVNHEIKTPLNSLYLNLQFLRRKINNCTNCDCINKEHAVLKNDMYSITSSIDSEITRINEILEEFVRYARFSPPKLEKKDLNKLIGNVSEIINQNAQESNVDIKLSLSEDTVLIMFDEKKIIQALLNLCVNAIHAMPYGGTLTIETCKDKENVTIYISDTGEGIAEEDITKIFDPFFTKKEGGLGFGLSIVQRTIEDHHGQIRCKSKVGKGTDFEIVLPANNTPEQISYYETHIRIDSR